MIFKNKFKKQDADALKKDASREVRESDAVKNAEKDPQGTYNQAKDLAKKTAGKGGNDGESASRGARANAGEEMATGDDGTRGTRSAAGQKASSRRSRDAAIGNEGYSREASDGYEEPVHTAGHSRGSRYANQPQEGRRRSGDMAGLTGGIGDPEDEFEETTNRRHPHSEFVRGSSYGSPASPRNDIPMATSESLGGDRSFRQDHSSTGGKRSRSPKGASSGTQRVNRNVSGTSHGDDGGVAGGGATSGAGGYGYDYPDYEDRSDWDRRHSKGSFSFPFFHHHHHQKDPREEAEEVGGATSAGAPGMVGSGTPTRAPVRANSKLYTSTSGSTASPTTGKNSAAVAGGDAAARRSGGPVRRDDDHAGYDTNGYGKRDGKVSGHRSKDDNFRGSHAGSVTRPSGEREGYGYEEQTEPSAAAYGSSSQVHSDSYRGGYEAGYLAAKRGEPLERPGSHRHSARNEAPSGYSNVPSGGRHKRAETSGKSKTNPFEGGKAEDVRYSGTGAERYGAHEGSRRGGNLGGAEEYGYGASSADEFGNERFDYDIAPGQDRHHKRSGDGTYNARGSYEGEGVGRRMNSGREHNEGVGRRVSHGKDYGSYEGEGVGRRMNSGREHDGGVGRRVNQGKDYESFEGREMGRNVSSGREYGSYEGEGVGRTMSPYEDEGVGRRTDSEGRYGHDAAGYTRSPGAAVGPGSDEYPESYGDDYYGDVNNAGVYGKDVSEADQRRPYGAAQGTGRGTATAGMGAGAEPGGHAGGIAKAVDKAGGAQKIEESVNKVADSKVGGMAKGKAAGFAKDQLGDTKAGELADKAKLVPGANDAAKKAQGAVGKGISSKLAAAGGGTGGATGAAGAAGATGAAGAAGTAGGTATNAKGRKDVDHDIAGAQSRRDASNAYGQNPRGYGYEGSRGYGDGMSHGETVGMSHGATADHYGRQNTVRGGDVGRTGFYDDSRYKSRQSGGQAEPVGGFDHGYDDRRYGHADLVGETDGTRYFGDMHEATHTVYAPSGGRSYGHPGQEAYSPGNFGDEAGMYDVTESNEGRPSGHNAVGETDSRLRRAPGEFDGERKRGREEQLGISDGNQVSAIQEQRDYGGDSFSREASANSADYYDSSEAVPSSRQQGTTTGSKKPLHLGDRTTRSPSMSRPVDPYNQDTSVPRFGFQGLFGHKASTHGGTSGASSGAAHGGPGGGEPMSTPVRSGSMRDSRASGGRAGTQQGVSPKNGEVNSAEPVGRARSAPNVAAEVNTNPSSARKGTERSQANAGRATGEEGRRFADTFGNSPSLIDPSVPTYGWGTKAGAPAGGERASEAGAAGTTHRDDIPEGLPVMRKKAEPNSSKRDSSAHRGSNRGNRRQAPTEDVRGQDNYVTSQRNVRGRSDSLISDEEDGDAYDRKRYTEYGRGQGTRQRGAGQHPEYIDESSRIPRSATDEAGEEGADSEKTEPGIFERIRSAFTPSSHSDTATNA